MHGAEKLRVRVRRIGVGEAMARLESAGDGTGAEMQSGEESADLAETDWLAGAVVRVCVCVWKSPLSIALSFSISCTGGHTHTYTHRQQQQQQR